MKSIPTNEEIGAKIRERRLKLGLGQPELGKSLGVSHGMVQHYETGRSALTVVQLANIARALKCKLSDLMP